MRNLMISMLRRQLQTKLTMKQRKKRLLKRRWLRPPRRRSNPSLQRITEKMKKKIRIS